MFPSILHPLIQNHYIMKHGVFIRTKLINVIEQILCGSFKLELGNLKVLGHLPIYIPIHSSSNAPILFLTMKHMVFI